MVEIKLSNFYRPPPFRIHICSPAPRRLRHNQNIAKLSRFERGYDFLI
jgi:hypothetical protein